MKRQGAKAPRPCLTRYRSPSGLLGWLGTWLRAFARNSFFCRATASSTLPWRSWRLGG